MAGRVRVVVHSPNAAILAGLTATLNVRSGAAASVLVLAEVPAADELPRRVAELRPDVLVLHGMADGRPLPPDRPEHGVRVVLAVTGDEVSGTVLLHALRSGVAGVVSVDDDLDALGYACREAAEGSAYLSPALVRLLIGHLSGADPRAFAAHGLTVRETQVLRRLTAGESSSDIAGGLQIDQRTVKHHLANIYRKLNARGQVEAVVLAYRKGLVV
jgi:DNA-binding NarL/FixJ family response regulator